MRTKTFAVFVGLALLLTGLFAVLPAGPVHAQSCGVPGSPPCPTDKPRNKKKPTVPPPPRWTSTPVCLDAEGTKVACPTRTATITPPCLDAITGKIVACVPPPCLDKYQNLPCTKTPTAGTPPCMNPLDYKVEDYKSDKVACATTTPTASAGPAAGGGNPPSGPGLFGMIIAVLIIGVLSGGLFMVVQKVRPPGLPTDNLQPPGPPADNLSPPGPPI